MKFVGRFLLILTAYLVPDLAVAQDIIPRHPQGFELPEIGSMQGFLDCDGVSEGFGYWGIHALGDINGDAYADYLIGHTLCDTTLPRSRATELLLYYGQRAGLPSASAGIPLIGEDISFRSRLDATGDWDGDGNLDLLIRYARIRIDTVRNPAGFTASISAVWWGDSTGTFSIEDTTHLRLNPYDSLVIGPHWATSFDFSGDGVDDLIVNGANGIDRENPFSIYDTLPQIQGFYGARGKRWGRDLDRLYDFTWSEFDSLASGGQAYGQIQRLDHDADGVEDLILFLDQSRSPHVHGRMKILYGRRGEWADTANVHRLVFDSIGGKKAGFADLSGDEIPELVVNCGYDEVARIYIGFKGQRLLEQYGKGIEEPRSDSGEWWGRPFATLPLPGKLHEAWSSAGWSFVYPFGDANNDGIEELWVGTTPDIVAYVGGEKFDSLYDTWMRVPGGFGPTQEIVRLGVIDGTGLPVFALDFAPLGVPDPGTVKFHRASESVPSTGVRRQWPEGTTEPSSSTPPDQSVDSLDLTNSTGGQ